MLALFQNLANDNPAVTDFRNRQAFGHLGLGWLLSITGKPPEAEAEFRTALEIQQKLADDNPSVTEFRADLAVSHNDLGWLLSHTDKPADGKAEYRKCWKSSRSYSTTTPPSSICAATWQWTV